MRTFKQFLAEMIDTRTLGFDAMGEKAYCQHCAKKAMSKGGDVRYVSAESLANMLNGNKPNCAGCGQPLW